MVRIAVVGDVHGQWDFQDAVALKWMSPDVVVYVGDFGEEESGPGGLNCCDPGPS